MRLSVNTGLGVVLESSLMHMWFHPHNISLANRFISSAIHTAQCFHIMPLDDSGTLVLPFSSFPGVNLI